MVAILGKDMVIEDLDIGTMIYHNLERLKDLKTNNVSIWYIKNYLGLRLSCNGLISRLS